VNHRPHLIASLLLLWINPLIPADLSNLPNHKFLNFFPTLTAVVAFAYNLKQMKDSQNNPTSGNYMMFYFAGVMPTATIARFLGII
jgi:hypothetical protein